MSRTNRICTIASHKWAAELILAFTAVVLLLAALPASAADRVVQIESGVIEGVPALTPGVTAYLRNSVRRAALG